MIVVKKVLVNGMPKQPDRCRKICFHVRKTLYKQWVVEFMGNILDYLDWRGDLAFSQSPFNEVDNLILACFSYLELDERSGRYRTAILLA